MLEVLISSFSNNFGSFSSYALQHFFTFPADIEFESPTTSPPNLHIPTQEEEEEIEAEIAALRQKHVKLEQEINTAKETRDTLKNNVEIITNLRGKLQNLLQDNNINVLEKDVHNIIASVNNLNQKVASVDNLHQKK